MLGWSWTGWRRSSRSSTAGGSPLPPSSVHRSQSRVSAHIAGAGARAGGAADRPHPPPGHADRRPGGCFARHAREIVAGVGSARSAVGALRGDGRRSRCPCSTTPCIGTALFPGVLAELADGTRACGSRCPSRAGTTSSGSFPADGVVVAVLPTLAHPLAPGLQERLLWREPDPARGQRRPRAGRGRSAGPGRRAGALPAGRVRAPPATSPRSCRCSPRAGWPCSRGCRSTPRRPLVAMARAGVGVGVANAVALDARRHRRPGGARHRRPGHGPGGRRLLVRRARQHQVGEALLPRACCEAPVPPGATRHRATGRAGDRGAAGGRVGVPRPAPDAHRGRASASRGRDVARSSAGSPSWRCCAPGLPTRSPGSRRSCCVQGPAGIGKTALIEHFLREPGVGRGAGGGAGQRRGDRVAAHLRRRRAARPFRGRGGRRAAGGGAAARGDPGRGPRHRRAPASWSCWTGSTAAPVVLVVDDVHWADLPSVQALVFALRRLVADPVLTLLAARDDSAAELPGEPAQAGQRPSAAASCGCAGWTRRTCATSPPSMGVDGFGLPAAQRLRYGTQGNPLHASALLEEFPPARWGSEQQPLPPPRSFRLLVHDRYAACAADHPQAGRRRGGARAALPAAARGGAGRGRATRCPPWTRRRPATCCTPSRGGVAVDAVVPAPAGPRRGLRRARARPAGTRCTSPRPGCVTDEAAVLRHRVAAAAEPDEGLAEDLTAVRRAEARRQAWQSAAAHLVEASRLSPDPGEAQRRVLRAVGLDAAARATPPPRPPSPTEIAAFAARTAA